MNTLEYNYISTIAKYQNFSMAAKKLQISQPALSNYVAKLERSLGILIFDRSTSPIQLTEPGEKYLQYANRILNLEKDFHSYITDYQQLHTGTLTIGSTHCFTSCYLPHVLQTFLSQYPDIHVNIIEGKIPSLETGVLEGKIDLLITADNVNPKQFSYEPLFQEELLLAVPPSFPINDSMMKYSISSKDLKRISSLSSEPVELHFFKDLNFILLEPEQHISKMSQQIFDETHISPKIIMRVEQLMSSFSFTIAGIGCSFITQSAICLGNFNKLPSLYRIKTSFCQRTMSIAYKKNRYLSTPCRSFINIAKKTLGEQFK